jgi:predicted nucleic acid-binding protein
VRIASSPVYLDASALAKVYIPEPESEALESTLAGRRDLIVSRLAVTEVASAMVRRVRERQLRRREMAEVYRTLTGHVAKGRFLRADITATAHREAERLLMTLGTRVPLRAADGLHLALAALAGARTLVTFDRRMTAAAAAAGTFDLIET